MLGFYEADDFEFNLAMGQLCGAQLKSYNYLHCIEEATQNAELIFGIAEGSPFHGVVL
jgi:hypothetical protein